jgi:hypothetical protein
MTLIFSDGLVATFITTLLWSHPSRTHNLFVVHALNVSEGHAASKGPHVEAFL